MTNKFVGRGGPQNRINVLLENSAVGQSSEIAKFISDNAEVVTYKKGDILIKQGSSENHIIFLLSGDVEITPSGQVPVVRSAPRTIGEMAALDPKQPRNATCIAKSDYVHVLRMNAQKIGTLVNIYPEFKTRLEADVRERFTERLGLRNNPNDMLDWATVSIIFGVVVFILFLAASAIPNFELRIWILIGLFIAWTGGNAFFGRHPKFRYFRLVSFVVRTLLGYVALGAIGKITGKLGGLDFLFDWDQEANMIVLAFGFILIVSLIVADILISKKGTD